MNILSEAAARLARREPFVLATVVWRRPPSSAQVGGKALIAADGTVTGWLGGACAEPEMLTQAREVLAAGEARLVLLGQADDLADAPRVGRHQIAMACDSEGAVEINLEPFTPVSQLIAVGRSPAVEALVAVAQAVGWDAVAVTEPSLETVSVDAATAIVVMSQGHFDDLALREALATDAGYVGLVASRKRADSTLQLLQDGGMCPGRTSRVHAPAGMDLGATTHAEMAIALMADLVERRARGELSLDPATPAVDVPATAIDPVCGMTVVIDDSHYATDVGGETFHFCAAGCRTAFTADPTAFGR